MPVAAVGPSDPPIPDLTDQQTFAGGMPYEAFATLRDRPGLYWQPTTVSTQNGGFWAVTRYEDVVAVERDVESFTSTLGAAYPTMIDADTVSDARDSILMKDPPDHTRLRRAAAMGFAPKVVAHFEPWVRDIVRSQIDAIRDKQRFDAVEAFAQTIPAHVIARVMGAPADRRAQMVDWVKVIFGSTQQHDKADLLDQDRPILNMGPIIEEVSRFSLEIQEIKRRDPDDDMFTALSGCVDRGEISQSEFLMWMFVMMAAGYETTNTTIAHAMRMYLEDEQVRDATDTALDEGLIECAVGEYVRLISPVIQMARTATRDLEFAGEQIRKNDVMVLYYAAANRDGAAFSDPDRFDPWRSETQHLGFGTGIHRCIGMSLAKLEVQLLFEELKANDLRLRLDGPPKRGWSNFVNQLLALPVARA